MSNARQLAANLPREGGLSNRNLIINGAMQVAQRGTSFTNTTSAWGGDRFLCAITTMGTADFANVSDAPSGFSNSIKWTCATADAAPTGSDESFIQHVIEAQNLQHLKYGSSDAETTTLSFWVKSSETGDFVVWLYGGDSTRIYTTSYTVSSANTWEYKTITISGDTSGAINNDNGQGIYIRWYVGSAITGSVSNAWGTADVRSLSGGPNVQGAVGRTFYITGVQLEVGTATPFEHRSYSDTLQACQRFFQRITGAHKSGGAVGDRGVFMGHCWSTNSMYWVHHFTTPMRSGPSVSQSNSGSSLGTWYSGGSTAAPLSALNIQSGNEMRAEMYCTLSSTLPAGNGSWFRLNGDSYWVDFDAEL